MESYTHDGLTFGVVDGGPQDAPAERSVVLLHGFPQTSAAWHQVSPRLHEQGLRTLAPDNRGVAPMARPPRRRDYRIEHLVDDVAALLDAAGLDRAHVVGHDWGGAIAWGMAQRHPDRVATLTVLSTPHPAAMFWAARHSTQAWQSWYMVPLMVPLVPEVGLGWALRRFGLRALGLPAEQEREYVHTLTQLGAVSGAVGPYRALPTMLPAGRSQRPADEITVPTTYVWGNRDVALGRAAAERTARYVTADYRFVELDADHWLPEKQPERVTEEIVRRVTGEA